MCTGAEALLAAKIAALAAGTAASTKQLVTKPKRGMANPGTGRLFPDLAGMVPPMMGTPPFNPNAPDPRAGMFGGGSLGDEDWQAKLRSMMGY